MFSKRILLPFFLSLIAAACLIAYFNSSMIERPAYYQGMKYTAGDDLAWSDPHYDDSSWRSEVPVIASANWWLRLPIKTRMIVRNHIHAGIAISVQGSYQLFWDGVLIGENGKWGRSKQEEVEGNRNNYFLIPDSLMKTDRHFIALRVSSFHDPGKRVYPNFSVGNYFNLVREELQFSVFMHILAGLLLVIGVYYFLLYFISYRYNAYLLFGILCFCFFAMIMMEYLRSYYLYPYSFHFKRLFIISMLALVIGNILSLFLLSRFELKNKAWILASLNILLVFVWFTKSSYDDKTKAISLIAFTFALFICLAAIAKKHKGSEWAFYGVLACLSCHINYDLMVYIGFCLLALFMLVSLSKQMREQAKLQQDVLLRSKRLEIELLKKNIQPHFIMNSLTSLMEWVERSPKLSIDFINALSNEFAILGDISSCRLIPVTQELALCQYHLEIMSFRKDIRYRIETSGIGEHEEIPPAILLTLIENGITHNIHEKAEIVFTIKLEKNKGLSVYTVFAPGIVKQGDKQIVKGTGINYIEARLEESYPGRWSLHNSEVLNGWKTIITVPDQSAKK